MKHKDPPGGSSRGIGKKQKTSSVFRAQYKDTVTVHDSGGDGNSKTFPDGKTMTCELWGISEDSEMCCSKMTQNRSTIIVSSNANTQPTCSLTAAATTANNVSQPLLTSTSAATCRELTTSSTSRPEGLSQQTLVPPAVVWKPQPVTTGPSM